MKAELLAIFEKWANWKSILALIILQTLFVLVILPGASPSHASNQPSLDMHFSYTPQKAYQIISTHNQEALQIMAINRLTLDIAYPLVYGLMISLLLIVSFRRAFPKNKFSDWAVFIPWAGVLCDYLENISLATMYLQYPRELIVLAWMASAFTALKWTFIGIGFLLVFIGAVKLVFIKKY